MVFVNILTYVFLFTSCLIITKTPFKKRHTKRNSALSIQIQNAETYWPIIILVAKKYISGHQILFSVKINAC